MVNTFYDARESVFPPSLSPSLSLSFRSALVACCSCLVFHRECCHHFRVPRDASQTGGGNTVGANPWKTHTTPVKKTHKHKHKLEFQTQSTQIDARAKTTTDANE